MAALSFTVVPAKNRADPAVRIGGTAMPENMAALAGLRPARQTTTAMLRRK